jgi:methylated-DNA-[protein]-cysteine S-methyltransferase
MHIDTLDSPIGELTLVSDGEALTGLYMDAQRHRPELPAANCSDDAVLVAARRQLGEYFAGQRREFDLPLRLAGTPFQREVWDALRDIPYGETAGYGELAQRLGRPGTARAVGMANGRNPIAIVVPCHRVIGSAGALTGYGGGLDRKRYLLELERAA